MSTRCLDALVQNLVDDLDVRSLAEAPTDSPQERKSTVREEAPNRRFQAGFLKVFGALLAQPNRVVH